MRYGLRPLPAVALAVAAGVTACGDGGTIETYRVAKLPPAPRPAHGPGDGHGHAPAHPGAEAPSGPRRMLAAIAPHGDTTWFFKLEGPADAVGPHAGAFDRFLRTVKLAGAEPAWELPEGWRQEAGSGMRFATLRVGGGDAELTLAVTRLGGDAGGVLANVNRWCGQLGLDPIAEKDLPDVAAEIPLDVARALRVDLTGQGGSPHARMPAPGPGAASAPARGAGVSPPAAPPFGSTIPADWRPAADASGMSVATYSAAGEGGAAKITVIPLDGDAGGLLPNVNRWRGQIGLAPLDGAALGSALGKIDVDGAPAPYIILPLSGEQATGDKAGQRILAAIHSHDGKTWFFKMQGSAAVVDAQQASFEAFLGSVGFEK